MCAIAGICGISDPAVQRLTIQQMLAAMHHRGPDGSGSFFDNDFALGHNRLAILDLSDAAAQPMHYDGLTLVYNGELYNYLEIREMLVQEGYRFNTQSDTEVLLKAMHCWGEAALQKFTGMWAFALYNAATNSLLLCRDRFGEKPLYYYKSDGQLLFCSEIKGLLAAGIAPKANMQAVVSFLVHEQAEHPEHTFFEGIKKLGAGCLARYALSTRALTVEPYYTPNVAVVPDQQEVLSRFSRLFQQSVARQLRSDVPVGTCLSGGLDSSFVAATASGHSGQPFYALTAAVDQQPLDERRFARQVVQHCGLLGEEILVDAHYLQQVMPQVMQAQEEPFGSMSIVMQYAVMERASSLGLKVLLDGQGADELMLGYRHQMAALYRMGLFPNSHNSWGQVIKHQQISSVQLAKLLWYHSHEGRQQARRLWRWRQLKPGLRDLVRHAGTTLNATPDGLAAWQQSQLTKRTLPALLRYEDKNAMHFSVETRLPFLDHELVAYCLSLPLEHKLYSGWTKYLQRQAMKDHLPDSITWRKGKIGFSAPESAWLHALDQGVVKQSALVHNLFAHQKIPCLGATHWWRLYAVAHWAHVFGIG